MSNMNFEHRTFLSERRAGVGLGVRRCKNPKEQSGVLVADSYHMNPAACVN